MLKKRKKTTTQLMQTLNRRTKRLLVFHKVNRFPNSTRLTRKDLLKESVDMYCSSLSYVNVPGHYNNRGNFNHSLQKFVLPRDFTSFLKEFTNSQRNNRSRNFWIMMFVQISTSSGLCTIQREDDTYDGIRKDDDAYDDYYIKTSTHIDFLISIPL